MAASGAPNRPPGSPWQERFLVHTGLMVGSARLSEGDGLRHSGLKPELPSVPDPKYYLEPPPSQQPALPVSKEELDRLFREEMIQSWVFRGGLTWQVAALNRWIELTPDIHMSGGHLQTDVGAFTEAARNSLWEKHRIQVDESKWFPFFRKERWFDWTQTSPPSQTTGRVWSVDDPKIWSQVSIALELADRFLKALLDVQQVDDDWTKVLPDEPEPYEGARVLLSHTKEAALAAKDGKPIPVDVPASKDKTEWQERLEWLLSTNIWCFQDSGGRSEGETMSVIMHPHASITLVDIARVTALVDGDITLAERCRMLWKLADTMVHELCHAIIVSRWQNYIPGQVNVNRKTIGALAEVLINCEGIAESGLNMENCWFGGHSNHNPHGRIPLVTILFEVPNIETCSSYYNAPGAWNADGAPIRIAGSQASYMSRLLSEAWWQNPDLPKRALDYFHRPFVFTNEATYRPGFPKHWPEWTIHPPDPSGRSNPYSDANQRDVDAFNERIRLWQHIRAGWYQTEKTLVSRATINLLSQALL
ncbi:hypothetical protein F5Y10DRAFT_273538 [Nemania abortiva]|nr:hypothetical protein F5Y10DRAFT_273538 [Nemania abortiva]